ncbi:CoA transferase [Microbacterium sp. NIBRBAC000506063]|nr:CoA transferase [Microbacterium sp. NIBRBAC000506063]
MSGPYGTALLSDYGAEVIKVESAGSGDPSRQTGSVMQGDQNALYLMWNRGKKGIALNLHAPEGVEVVKRLAAESDVFVENYRPGVAEKIGLGYDVLKKLNPGLVYISVSGFGHGLLDDWPATDPVVQAMSGVMSLTGEIGGPPILVGVPIADFAGAMATIQAALVGLIARGKTGEGQYIEVSMMHALMTSLTTRLAMFWGTDIDPERLGGSHSAVAPYTVFRTKDGYMVAGVWGRERPGRASARPSTDSTSSTTLASSRTPTVSLIATSSIPSSRASPSRRRRMNGRRPSALSTCSSARC